MDLNNLDKAYSRVYFKVLNFLSFSKRSESEILGKIQTYIFKTHLSPKEKEILKDRVITNLKSDGYLTESNDEDYASSYIQGLKNSGKSFNKIRVLKFLLKKGISKDIMDESLSEIEDEDIYESVLKEAEKKIKYIKGENNFQKKQKLTTFLLRKGYPYETISSVIDTLTDLQ